MIHLIHRVRWAIKQCFAVLVAVVLAGVTAWPAPVANANPPKKPSLSDAVCAEIMSSGLRQELASRIVTGPVVKSRDELFAMNTYHYAFADVAAIERRIAGLQTRGILRRLFSKTTESVSETADNEKWLRFMDFLAHRLRHPPLTQPMYADRSMITHPLVLLLLGEGRCGHVARVIVDVAHANGYEARLVQLAAHLVAEVKWNGSWHWIDANADFPLQDLRAAFQDLPSIEELAEHPYRIDRLPARGWKWADKDYMSTNGAKLPFATWYPAELLNSSIYFGREILQNKFSGDPLKPRNGVSYYRKQGTFAEWETDKFYGWRGLSSTRHTIDGVPVEFHPLPVTVSAPAVVYQKENTALIPVRFMPAQRITIAKDDVFNVQPDPGAIDYEILVSSKSRGWNYDFRNYRFMPKSGQGDVAGINQVATYDGGMCGVDVQLDGRAGQVFIEVIPKIKSLQERGCFLWPSAEVCVQIYPEHFRKWNYGR